MAEQNIVDLVDAHVPADQGLSSLGLLMQLAGNVLAAYVALLTFMGLSLGGNGETLWILLVLGLSIARSFLHRSAGTQLLYGRPGEQGNRLAGVKRYIMFALAQSVMAAALLAAKFHVPSKIALAVMGGLAAWPATLAVLVRLPRFKRFDNDVPMPEDKGFEGASILMTVLGLCGAVGGGTVLLVMLEQPDSALTKGPGVLMVLTVAMLVVRSIIHVQAGISGLRETNIDRSVELANRYANFGVISSFCGGGALLLFVMSSAVSVFGMALITGLVWMLMAWPLIIRRFFSDRQFADLLAGEQAPVHRRAPDAGLTALGWLLLAYAVFGASFTLPTLVVGGGGRMSDLQELFAFGSAGELRSIWWNVGVIVLQAWAGFELIRMSPQSRIIATVFGVVGAGVALYTNWPLIEAFKHMRGFGANAIAIGPLALALILPVATLVLVNRKIAPTARARFRPKPVTPAT
jgi:hypothetical protein